MNFPYNNSKGERGGSAARTASKLRFMIMGAIGALFLNNLLISSRHHHSNSWSSSPDMHSHVGISRPISATGAGGGRISSDFYSTSDRLVEEKPASSFTVGLELSTSEETANGSNAPHLRHPRILMGIFSSDNMFDGTHRTWHRRLFENIWKDERVCTLSQFRNDNTTQQKCELIYTFVSGSNTDPNAPTERLEDTDTKDTPIELISGYKNPLKDDINWPDVTHLNIRENMNKGKSQTWFYFASKLADQFSHSSTPIDYAMKFDSDSILRLHDFLEFAHTRLPPAPYNNNIFGGALRDKGPWYHDNSKLSHPASELSRYESHWGQEYDGVHIYLAGQCYFMSMNLAKFVASEAPFSRVRVAKGGYIEGHEDHDIAAMVYHSPLPINLITIGKTQRFWEHPVKGAPRYQKIVKRETARVNKTPYKGKVLRLY